VLRRALSGFDRHPVLADTLLAAVLGGFALSTLFGEAFTATFATVLSTVLLVAPLALRRRYPVGSFAAVMLACGLELLLVDEFLAANAAALVALYSLVAYAPRRLAVAGAAVAYAGTVPFALHFDDLVEAGILAWLVLCVHLTLAIVLGDRRRVALTERAAIEDRARLLAAELEHQAALATALERERIARELHDVVGHALAVVVAQADGGRYAARSDPGAAVGVLDTISATARDALAEMRRAVGALRDQEGEEAPLRPAAGAEDLGALVERTREAGLTVDLAEEGSPRPLAPGASLTIYRVAQEALTNVLKHAGTGTHATVALRWAGDEVELVVRDDGSGDGKPSADGTGRGLAGMRARVEPRGGTLTAGPRPEGGFEVRARIPAGSAAS
jgi:signal transduction histidine kinase